MFDCIITVKGDGKGNSASGRPKFDKTGPVHQFLANNQAYYTTIYQHLVTCNTCDMALLLQQYLDKRNTNQKFGGKTSNVLCNFSLKIERLAKKKGVKLPDGLVNQFIWRTGTSLYLSNMHKYLNRLSLLEQFNGLRLQVVPEWMLDSRYMGELTRVLAQIANELPAKSNLSEEEIHELIKVAGVIYA